MTEVMHKNCNLLRVKKIWCWAFSFQIKQYVWKIRVFYSNSDIEASCQHHSDLHTPIYRTPSESKWSQSILTYNCTAKWTIPHFYAKTSILIHLKPKKKNLTLQGNQNFWLNKAIIGWELIYRSHHECCCWVI